MIFPFPPAPLSLSLSLYSSSCSGVRNTYYFPELGEGGGFPTLFFSDGRLLPPDKNWWRCATFSLLEVVFFFFCSPPGVAPRHTTVVGNHCLREMGGGEEAHMRMGVVLVRSSSASPTARGLSSHDKLSFFLLLPPEKGRRKRELPDQTCLIFVREKRKKIQKKLL